MSGYCAGIKRDGGRCTTVVTGDDDYCYQHDPARADERRRGASRAGRSRPARELAQIKRQLSDVIEAVRNKELDKGIGAVVFQGFNTLLKAIEVERKENRLEQIERDIADLERRLGE